MKRKFLFAWYETPRGKLLQQLEAEYLQRSITVGCQQTILQIGALGWENEFIDFSLYKNYTVLDVKGMGFEGARKIRAKAYHLPLQCDSVDMVIVPHLLEFDANRFATMREIERILKPEGQLIIMNFNPLSLWVRYQYIWDKKMADSWGGHFISRGRILDWLKLLNFEVGLTAEFKLETVKQAHSKSMCWLTSLLSTAYAIKATKRRYGMIPLTPVKNSTQRLVLVNALNPTAQAKEHD